MPINLVFCGDIMLGAEVDLQIGPATVAEWLSPLSSVWSDADLLIGNLECPCVQTASPIDGPEELILHAPRRRLLELAECGFSLLSLANNHILDCGVGGLRETIAGLNETGIHYVGAGEDLNRALDPRIVEVKGRRIGFVAFCFGPPAGRKQPGVAPAEFKWMKKALSRARKHCDYLVAILHTGLEYSDVPPTRLRSQFRFLAENGADIVIGHHPHVLQGLEWHRGVPIVYSLGDFLFNNSLPDVRSRNFRRMAMGIYAPQEVQRDPSKFSRGAVIKMALGGPRIEIEWRPFRQGEKLRPELSKGQHLLTDLAYLQQLSQLLCNPNDPRHLLADTVFERALWEERDTLEVNTLLRMALRPKFRYLPLGFKWLGRRILPSVSLDSKQ